MVRRRAAIFSMRIDPYLKEAAEKAALEDRRSLSSLVEKLLIDYCRGHGIEIEKRRPREARRK